MIHQALPVTALLDDGRDLMVGGCRVSELARQFGTPLYLYCQETIERSIQTLRDAMGDAGSVHYAAKAYLAPWLLEIVRDAGIGLDVCSGPELELALSWGFPPHRIRLHGNNKSLAAIQVALEQRIAAVVVDSLDELDQVAVLAQALRMRAPVLLRLNPGITAHTHQHLQTGAATSKFGLSIHAGDAEQGVMAALSESQVLNLLGYHAHIGTQILDLASFRVLMQVLIDFARAMQNRHGFWPAHLSPGGGAGICYTDEQPLDLVAWMAVLKESLQSGGLAVPHLSVEPGRAIVGPAGVAVYSVGTIKTVGGERIFVSLDGGMADNIRPALYGAQYVAVPVTHVDGLPWQRVTLAGSYCESGDILIEEAYLPPLQRGDLVAVPAAGAYCLAMASNYNGALRPAVVVVQRATARLVQRRQTVQDLCALEVS